MKTDDFYYLLPPERIAQTPIEPRHNARLLVINRAQNTLQHSAFWQIDEYLNPGDLLVINRTRVIPARLFARKETGGKVEILLLHRVDDLTWETLVGGKGLKEDTPLQVINGPRARIVGVLEGSRRLVSFSEKIEPFLDNAGQMPLPPYIHTRLQDRERYQTVYADRPGSAAAPTAGLHFTPQLMQTLELKGVRFAEVTLHVGLDTFAPVKEDDPTQHVIHTEWCELDQTAAQLINLTRQNGHRIIAVGTTSVRTLETAAQSPDIPPGDVVKPFSGSTALFILPGYTFKAVDAMVTNFHLPRSTLLMLVSAFAGRERILDIYRQAVDMEYRFFSFGDAMFIQ